MEERHLNIRKVLIVIFTVIFALVIIMIKHVSGSSYAFYHLSKFKVNKGPIL